MEFWDDYKHENTKSMYIFESIKSKEIEESLVIELPGCTCQNDCTIQKCSCMQRSGTIYQFDQKSNLKNYNFIYTDEEKPIYECNDKCGCEQICGNRLVQFGPRKSLQITGHQNFVNSKLVEGTKGYSLYTTEPILKGNFICEYAGEVITENEAQKRFKNNKEMNYIFCLNEIFGNETRKTFVDPTFYGNIGKYINHSCEPNSVVMAIRIHNVIPGLYIFASEDIARNSEVTFSYGNEIGNEKPCLCASKNCRKFLPCNINIW